MKQHEREYFISRIISGKTIVKENNIKLSVLTPTVDDELEINIAYMEAYKESIDNGCMTMEENLKWMTEQGVWGKEKDKKIKEIEENVEKIKLKMFEMRNKEDIREGGRRLLRTSEQALSKLLEEKNTYFSTTAEGIATTFKTYEMIRRCTYVDNQKYDFKELSVDHIAERYFSSFLSEKNIRELSRTDPWVNFWNYCDKDINKLFPNKGRELSVDQKNIFMWSKMYDNIHDSSECPDDSVINDDDVLDGWFILQRKKREQEKKESDMEQNLNSEISSKQEVFLMASDREEAMKIDSINNQGAQFVKRQRFNKLKKAGQLNQIDFEDEQLKLKTQATEGIRTRLRR